MIILNQTLISEDILEKNFVCNLEKCKGVCCIEGTSGAPLEEDEIRTIESILPEIKPYMQKTSLEFLENHGYYEIDSDGDAVTNCLPNGECVFVTYNENLHLQCAIQKAYQDKKITFEKPISCHLYPIRTQKVGDYIGLNYNQWNICSPACKLGDELKVPVYRFLKTPLIRLFGEDWYNELDLLANDYLSEK